MGVKAAKNMLLELASKMVSSTGGRGTKPSTFMKKLNKGSPRDYLHSFAFCFFRNWVISWHQIAWQIKLHCPFLRRMKGQRIS